MADADVESIRELAESGGLAAPSIHEQRRALDESAGSLPVPDGVTVTATTVAGRPAEWLTPDPGTEAGVVLYLHGGGYCLGSIRSHRNLAARLALAFGGRVLTLDYRLAPEDPFPAALDDVRNAYAELLGSGLAAGQIAVAGDSAGGGLTVASLVAIRDAGLEPPAAGVCLSPWVDLTQSSSSYETRAGADPLVSKDGLDLMAAAYAAGTTVYEPLVSPLFADLAGLPPLLVQVGDAEVLLDDALALRDTARAAGVDVTCDHWPDMVHVFQAFPPELMAQADESIAKVGTFLRQHLSAPVRR
jgi:phosphinothricin tripeptide acetyl hydrolase